MCILRQIRRLGPPCLRAFHSPSPSALIPVLSTARQSLLAAMRGDQKVQRASPTTIRQVYVQRLLTAAKGAEIRHLPVQPYQLQQALNEACRLPERHAEQARGSARSGLKHASGMFPGRPSPFSVRQAWIAATLNCCRRPRLPVGGIQTI